MPEGAVRLIEFLLSDEAQAAFAQANYEYPVRDGIELAPEVAAWGDFKADTLPLEVLGQNARQATMIFDEDLRVERDPRATFRRFWRG